MTDPVRTIFIIFLLICIFIPYQAGWLIGILFVIFAPVIALTLLLLLFRLGVSVLIGTWITEDK
jgi:hypothetical protein